MKTKEKKNFNEKNTKKVKRSISIITVFLWIFLVATMVTIIAGNVRNTNAYGSESVQVGFSSGKYLWTETIVYHANYPNSADDTYRIDYTVRCFSNTDTIHNLIGSEVKPYNEMGFTVPEGYKLKSGWYSNKTGGSAKSIITLSKGEGRRDVYAQYEKTQFRLTYNANGGSSDGELSYEDTDNSGNIFITDVEVKRSGYKFLGWSTDKKGKGKRYSPGERIVLTNDTTFYAVWVPLTPQREYLHYLLGDFVKVKCVSSHSHYNKDRYYNIMEKLGEYAAEIGEVYYSEEKELYLCDIDLDKEMYCRIYNFAFSEEDSIHVLYSSESPYKYITLYYDELEGEWKPLDNIEFPIVFKVRCDWSEYIGEYKVIHEYYLKDKNGNLNLENTIAEKEFTMFGSEKGVKVGISNEEETVDVEIKKKPYCNMDNVKYIYEYYENSGNVTVLPGVLKEITLKYVREEENETKIKVEKIWEDENNKYGKRPENVVLQIKNGEEIVSEMSVSEENNWSCEFVVPKYDKEGNEIEYTVDEKETSEFYEKIIDGYKVINKYKVEENNKNKENNNNDIIKNEENVDTSDINVWMYVGIVIVSIVVITILIILVKKNNK